MDLDNILFDLLNGNVSINGGIYKGDDGRPDDSKSEDISINTIDVSQEYSPQIARSNVNIHIPDEDVNIDGRVQKKANSKRLNELTKSVLEIVRNANIHGLKIVAEDQTIVKDREGSSQHYCNIRIAWMIHA